MILLGRRVGVQRRARRRRQVAKNGQPKEKNLHSDSSEYYDMGCTRCKTRRKKDRVTIEILHMVRSSFLPDNTSRDGERSLVLCRRRLEALSFFWDFERRDKARRRTDGRTNE
jgi:hypothetical protein